MAYHGLVDGEQTGPFEVEALAMMVWSPEMAEWPGAGLRRYRYLI